MAKGIGCIGRLLISLLIVIVVIVAVGAILVNMTPDKLGFADIELFDGKTLRDLGLADIKLIEVFKLLKSMLKPNEAEIVTNPYVEETEATNSTSNLENSNIAKDENGKPDYTTIVTDPVVYDKEYLISYSDTTLAYIFNQMIVGGMEAGEENAESEDSVEFLRELKAKMEEVTITGTGADAKLRIVASMDISSIKAEVEGAVGGLASIIPIPEKIFIVSYSAITADANGYVVVTGESIRINDAESQIADAIFKVLGEKAEEQTGESIEGNGQNQVNKTIGEAFSSIIKNLGRVGTATVDADNVVVTKTLGAGGISEHKITLITNTNENLGA